MNHYSGPQRIVCLTPETAETLYLLGEEERIVGVSGFTRRPREILQKPKISTFTSAKIDQILELKPDLAIGFSRLQAQIAHDLIKAGVSVLIFNQQSVEDVLESIVNVSRLVSAEVRGLALARQLRNDLASISESARRFPRRPRVYFEEWMDPLISGIRWVDELIELAGGDTVFPHLRFERDSKRRVVTSQAVIAAQPEVILASWCGRKVEKQTIRERDGWAGIPALSSGHLYEIKSAHILQPGPASLTEGVRQIHTILAAAVKCRPAEGLEPEEPLDPDFKL